MRHTIATLSRGDAHKIGEWVDYHARLGFDDLQIVLDGDVDGTAEVLRALDVPATVTVHLRDEIGEYYDDLDPEERRRRVQAWRERYAAELASGEMRGVDSLAWRQHLHLPAVMAPYAAGQRGRGWLAFFDVDEYVVLGRHRTVADLTAEATAPRLRLPSFDVDTTGHDPTLPVLEQHTTRWSHEDLRAHPDARWTRRVKSLVRYRVAHLDHTVHKISRGRYTRLDPEVARIHHFKVPVNDVGIPYTVADPVHLPG